MSASAGALLVPELRWDPGYGFAHLAAAIDDALELGVAGFLLHGGPRREVQALTRDLHRRAHDPILIAASAERGAGERFVGATGLPPAGALGLLRDPEAIRRAARLTARELRDLGVNWALAPVADLDVNAASPSVGARAFGSDAQRVAEWVVEWIDACQAEGVMACARHFPGVGRSTGDPYVSVAHVEASAQLLWREDLLPFRGATDAGVASVMASHVVFPSLDESGAPAARSRAILTEFLRGELKYDGLIVCDALATPGARFGTDEAAAAVEAVAAGCDLILAPSDPVAVAEALDDAVADGRIDGDALAASRARRRFWAGWARPEGGREATLDDVLWARQVADTVTHAVRGAIPNVSGAADVILVDDRAPAAWPGDAPVGDAFVATLAALGVQPRVVDSPTDDSDGVVIVLVFGEAEAGRGRAGYTEGTRGRVAEFARRARDRRRTMVALVFGHPRLAGLIPEAPNVLCCWGGERAMQEAAARRLSASAEAR